MTAHVTQLLDQLDAVVKIGTTEDHALPWRQDSGWGEDILTAPGVQFSATGHPDQAALIVAAVNALPQLTAAIRAVLAYCQEIEEDRYLPGLSDTEELRNRITAALTPTQATT